MSAGASGLLRKPTEKSKKEVKEDFLNHVSLMVNYWEKVKIDKDEDVKERLEGLAFSILVAIDGGAMALPSFILAPDPHEEDKDFHLKMEESYYPYNGKNAEGIRCNISGSLHDEFVREYSKNE